MMSSFGLRSRRLCVIPAGIYPYLQVLLLLQHAKTRKAAEERAEKAKWSKVSKCAS